MAKNRIICHCKNIDYIGIRKAMIAGARTIEDIKEATGAATECGGCIEEILEILSSVCGCMGTSIEEIVDVVKKGTDNVERVGQLTEAGTKSECGRCKPLIQNIIDLGR